MTDGIAYVRVQADERSNDIQTLAGSGDNPGGGVTYGSYRLMWSFEGGFQDIGGWNIPGIDGRFPSISITFVAGDVEATNQAISAALNGKNYYYVDYILNTLYCGQTIMGS